MLSAHQSGAPEPRTRDRAPEPRTTAEAGSENSFRFNLDALSVPEALETTIRSLSARSVVLARRLSGRNFKIASEIPDPGSVIPDPGSRIPDPGCGIRNPGSGIRDPGSQIPDPRTRRTCTRPRAPESQISTPANFAIEHRIVPAAEFLASPPPTHTSAERGMIRKPNADLCSFAFTDVEF